MEIREKTRVILDYRLVVDGKVIDEQHNAEFFVGFGVLLKGLEKELLGLKPGDEKSFTLIPKDAYGDYHIELIQKIPKAKFPEEQQQLIVKGKMLQLYVNGIPAIATVRDVNEHTVTLDFNHPLAGKELNFTVKINQVFPATVEELKQKMF